MTTLIPESEAHWLLLTAALSPNEESSRAFEKWRDGVDVQKIDFHQLKLLPALAERIGDQDPGLASQLDKILKVSWVRTQAMIARTMPAFAALREHSIPLMLMKGAAVIHHAKLEIKRRPMNDIDMLVPFGEVTAATKVLVEHGMHPPDWIEVLLLNRPDAITSLLHGMNFEDAVTASLDLHWQTIRQSLHPQASAAVWDAAGPASWGDVDCLVPSREDTLLQVITHAGGRSTDSALQWADDAVLLIGDGDLDWDRVRHQARTHEVEPMLRDALKVLRKVNAAPIPAGAARGLHRPSPANQLANRFPDAARYARYGYDFGPGTTRDILIAERDRRGALHATKEQPQAPLDRQIDIVMGGHGEQSPHLIAGWHCSEPDGTWSRDRQATVRLRTGPTPEPLTVTIEFVPFLTKDIPTMRADWLIDGRLVSRGFYDAGSLELEQLTFSLDPKVDRDAIDLELHVHDPRSGLDAGHNEDFRKLGIQLRSVLISVDVELVTPLDKPR